jgi:HD superfamily phosphodiesterase
VLEGTGVVEIGNAMNDVSITQVMKEMIDYFQKDVRRINHALKVYDFSHIISKEIEIDDYQYSIISYAALLHDIGIKEAERKYNSSNGKYQEIEGPTIARNILKKLEIDEEVIERVCYIIGNHHSYLKIEDVDLQILVEADFLVNIYEDDMDPGAIRKVREKIFRTKTGIQLLNSMYLEV